MSQELENYLVRLEKCLGPISISEKAEIITEIKSHVLDAIENDESKTVAQILASLGEPEQVANKYLLERGLEPRKPPKHPVIKWVTIGFLGTFGITALFVFALIWKFSPIVKVDEEKGRVQILGGLVDINEDSGTVSIGDKYRFNNSKFRVTGEQVLSNSNIREINMSFSNGKVFVKNTIENKFKYNCQINGNSVEVKPTQQGKSLVFSLVNFNGSKCTLELPSNIKLAIEGNNGKVQLKQLQNDISVKLLNGKIGVAQDPKSQYRYQTSVVNGKMDAFSSSDSKKAYQVKLSVMNGKISQI